MLLATIFIKSDKGTEETKSFLFRWDHIAKHQGLKFCIAHHKAIRLAVTRWLAGEPLKTVEKARLLKNGLPKGLSPGVRTELLKKEPKVIRGVLTLLTVGRCFSLPVEPDTSSITDPFTGSVPTAFLEGLSGRTDLKGRIVRKPSGRVMQGSTKSGPAGFALEIALPLLGSLPSRLIESIKILGGKRLSIYIDDIMEFHAEDLKTDLLIRKIHHLQDKEGKTRTIGIMDWWSQTALKPWHDDIMSLLRKQPGDCTFHSIDVQEYLSDTPGNYYSFDLSSATDRFPMEIQWAFGKHRWSEEVANAWKEIIVQYEFSDRGTLRKYGAGQPIGAYSSGATFSICHHLVLQYIQEQVPDMNYIVLGDDVVIKGDEGAKRYKDFLNQIKVPISEAKTHVSKDTFEFAKRWYHHGIEVTPFPLNSLLQASTRFVDIVGCLREAAKRGEGSKEVLTQPGLISNYLQVVHGMKIKHSQNIERTCLKFWDFLDGIQKDQPIEHPELLWRLTDQELSSGISQDRQEEILNAIGQAGTKYGEEIDERIQEALSAYGKVRSDQLDNRRGQFEVPVIRALRDTAQDIHEKMYELVKILGTAEEMCFNGKAPDRHVGEILRSIAETKIPDAQDASKRSSALILRSSATVMRNLEKGLKGQIVLEDYSENSQKDFILDDYRGSGEQLSIEALRPYAKLL